ncbi:hypothetical protein NX08_020550 [Xanthomonas vasicola]|uniref:TniQ family protein n=3 Tax=Xanthomonas vasicola TaxID=56459 RepID=UPI0009B90C3D|nr:TniQ family protein [Xanthomonas vasicola]AZR35203.1 hypothetical protein NX08_012710 [Xanthomonas vasicola]AZR36462.1 hypothetical protein NX08_020550 [Xanthomonas vasicola]
MRTAGWDRPVADELLSSYLVRVAIAQGTSAHRLCARYAPGVSVWTRDIDRCAPERLIRVVADQAQVSVDRIEGMCLSGWRELAPRTHPMAAITPWISAVGTYHRLRRRYGLHYCPACLEQDGAFLRCWRLSFVTACPMHEIQLRDRCGSCGEPVAPHRQGVMTRCWHCQGDLCAGSRPLEKVGLGQRWLSSCLCQQSSSRGAPSEIWLGLKQLLEAFAGRPSRRFADAAPRMRIELGDVQTQRADMRLLDDLIAQWPRSLWRAADRQGLNQLAFPPRLPPWLDAAVSKLPAGHPRGKRATPSTRLKAVQRAEAALSPGWRTERAEFLLDQVRQRRGH